MNTLASNRSKDPIKSVIITSNNVMNTLAGNRSKDPIKSVIITSNNVMNIILYNILLISQDIINIQTN
ncbi:MAG: hypothetical protein Terrestrivirus6_41 [Terrestrivirus sp.]|uniref:Uncharacterized protein n=1 Tax=Terrestrivirus sp. TaxID=2487775 RepID=A0A3G4ZNG8_9VIRU|nr:MAG: hypothetical protein Terrestrivirus6_41 [Terrestrivirus sp.]